MDTNARVHLTEIDHNVADLPTFHTELDRVIDSCRHGAVGNCKIIETMGARWIASM